MQLHKYWTATTSSQYLQPYFDTAIGANFCIGLIWVALRVLIYARLYIQINEKETLHNMQDFYITYLVEDGHDCKNQTKEIPQQ